MLRYTILLLLIILVFGCKEVYDPDIENDKTVLVIQGMLTNNPGETSVKLALAVPYDSTDNQIPVRGANVTIHDDKGESYKLSDQNSNSYKNDQVYALPGRTYYLSVILPDGTKYESRPQILPEAYEQDSIYAENTSLTTFVPTVSGDYFPRKVNGIETYVDLTSGSTDLPKCRYDSRVTVLYSYIYPIGAPPPVVYCWKTFNPNANINLTSSRFDRSVGIISKHSIGFFNTNVIYYAEKNDITPGGWLITINKYSMSSETHQYYLKIKNQLEAAGKIFDPTPSQIYGNLKCITDPKKMVFGFFEVSYAERLYYRYYSTPKGLILSQKDEFPGFTNEGESIGNPPLFWYN